MNWVRSKYGHCLFSKETTNGNLQLLDYVDDIIIMGADTNQVREENEKLARVYKIKDLGEIHDILGKEVLCDRQKKTLLYVKKDS